MKKATKRYLLVALTSFYGRGERIRTFDPLVPNQMRYQAALRPDKSYILQRLFMRSGHPVD